MARETDQSRAGTQQGQHLLIAVTTVVAGLAGAELGIRGAGLVALLAGVSITAVASWPFAWFGEVALRLRSWRKAGAFAACITLATAVWLALALNTLNKVQSRFWKPGVAALGASFVAGALFASAYLHLRWLRTRPHASQNIWLERASVAAWLGVGAAAFWLDVAAFPSRYEAAHLALRIATVVGLLVPTDYVLRRVFPRPMPPRRLWWGIGLTLTTAAACMSMLGRTQDYHSLLPTRFASTALNGLRAATDVDRDGYGSTWLGGGDCAPFDSSVYPFANDIPGNGRDEDCFEGDRVERDDADTVPQTGVASREPRAELPNIILVTIDTVRADRLHTYGASRDTMPRLEAWTAPCVTYERAYAPGTRTVVSLGALLHGRWPRQLKWVLAYETRNYEMVRADAVQHGPIDPNDMVSSYPLAAYQEGYLPERLSAQGYRTGAIFDDGATGLAHPKLGLFPGFDTFASTASGSWRSDADTTRYAVDALKELQGREPFFLWVHYFGPHGPDIGRSDVGEFGNTVEDRYDGTLARTDRALAPLLQALRGLDRQNLVIITSDHGEHLTAATRLHGPMLDEGSTHVPLWVCWPGTAPTRTRTAVSLIDVYSTITATAGVPHDGTDLRYPTAVEARPRAVFTSAFGVTQDGLLELDAVAAVLGDDKVVLDLLSLDRAAYSLAQGEQPVSWNDTNLALLRDLRLHLARWGPWRIER